MTHLKEVEIRHIFSLPDSAMAMIGVDKDFNESCYELEALVCHDNNEILL